MGDQHFLYNMIQVPDLPEQTIPECQCRACPEELILINSLERASSFILFFWINSTHQRAFIIILQFFYGSQPTTTLHYLNLGVPKLYEQEEFQT